MKHGPNPFEPQARKTINGKASSSFCPEEDEGCPLFRESHGPILFECKKFDFDIHYAAW